METSCLPVIGLHDVKLICHTLVNPWKAASEVKRGYVISMSMACVTRPVCQVSGTVYALLSELSRLVAAPYSCILLNFFHTWTVVECGGVNKASAMCAECRHRSTEVWGSYLHRPTHSQLAYAVITSSILHVAFSSEWRACVVCMSPTSMRNMSARCCISFKLMERLTVT